MADYSKIGDSLKKLLGVNSSVHGELGYTVDSVFRVIDETDSRKFYVRFADGNFVSAYHQGLVSQIPGLPVLVGVNQLGQPVILGTDPAKASIFLSANLGDRATVGLHDHVRNGGMEYVTDTWLLKQLRMTIVSGLTVSVADGPYMWHKHLKWWSAATLSLSGFVPTGIAQRCWVIVGIDPLANSLVAYAGTASIVSSLNKSDIPLISFYELGYVPVAAIYLVYGDTSLPNYRIEDLRFLPGSLVSYIEDIYNVSSQSNYSGYSLTYDGHYWVGSPVNPVIPPSTGNIAELTISHPVMGSHQFNASGVQTDGAVAIAPGIVGMALMTPPTEGGHFSANGDPVEVMMGGRELLVANRTYYVRTDGSNTNDGLSNSAGGAFLTIQKAMDTVAALDRSIYNVTVQIGAGTYTGAISIIGWGPGSGVVSLLGDTTTPSNVVLNVTGYPLAVANCALTVGGFKIIATAVCIYAYRNGFVSVTGKMEYGASGYHFWAETAATIQVTANYTVSGGATDHVNVATYGSFIARALTITLTGTPAFSDRFIASNLYGFAYVDGNTFSGSATGSRYAATFNGLIYVAGAAITYLPGNAVGATSTQGQYA